MKPDLIARLKDLVNGNREPANGMEKHFLQVIKGDSRPCTAEEKECYAWWKGLEKTNPTVQANPQQSVEKNPRKKEPMAIVKIGGFWKIIKKTNEENTRFLDAERTANRLIAARSLENNKLAQVTGKSKNKSSSFTKSSSRNKPTINMNTGWTSLRQGDKRFGDAVIKKQYVDEGIAGTRNANKEMKKMQSADTLKRNRGD